jgi:hypothetical protein
VEVSALHTSSGQDKATLELVNHSTGQRVPLLDLNLSAADYNDAVTYIYRTVAECAGEGC